MLVHIPGVLTVEQTAHCRAALERADWTDGRATAGYLSARAKNNEQLAEGHPLAVQLGDVILNALEKNPLFTSAALPLKIVPPLFNRYTGNQTYGRHIDGGVRPVGPHRVRTDLSATVFLSDPTAYDGGELVIEDTYGPRSVKLAAGDAVLYPGTSVHRVEPVTRGTRVAAFLWIQSMVRDNEQRTMLFDLDRSVQSLATAVPEHPSLVDLAGLYHNLLRQWADT